MEVTAPSPVLKQLHRPARREFDPLCGRLVNAARFRVCGVARHFNADQVAIMATPKWLSEKSVATDATGRPGGKKGACKSE